MAYGRDVMDTVKRRTATTKRVPATPRRAVSGGQPPPTPTPVPVGTDTAAGKAIMGGLGQTGNLFRQIVGLFAPRNVEPGTPTGSMIESGLVPGPGTRGQTLAQMAEGALDPLGRAFSAGLPFGAQASGMNPASMAQARYMAALANARLTMRGSSRVPRPR